MDEVRLFPLSEALKALNALRTAAGLAPEQFPVQAFVGMISDEVDALRSHGKNDDEIAAIVRGSSAIDITAAEIAEHYACPEQRQHHRD